MKNPKNVPTSPEARRVAAIMHRKLQTPWSEKEVRVFRKLLPIDEEDLANLERYYRRHWPPETGRNILRQDLSTLLNNFRSECDRANIWCAKHPVRERKIIEFPMKPKEPMSTEWTEEERAKNAEQRAKLRELMEQLKGQAT